MKKSAVLLIGFLVATLVVVSTGCGGDNAAPTPTGQTSPTPATEPITLKLVSAGPDTAQRAYDHFAALVEERTDGRVVIEVYPNGQLFPGSEQWEAVVTGSIDIFADATYYFREAVPDVLAFYVEGLFESYEHAYATLEDSAIKKLMAETVEEAAPVKLLGILPGSLSICALNSVRETSNLDDLEGLRTQGMPGVPPQPFYEYTGMISVPISPAEAPTAFIQGVLDAVHYPPVALAAWGLYETGEHALCRYSLFVTNAMLINQQSWESLPQDVRDIILNEVMPETYEFHKKAYRDDETAGLELIEQNVETLNWVTPEELEGFFQYLPTHNTYKVQMLMIDPELIELIEGLRPSDQ